MRSGFGVVAESDGKTLRGGNRNLAEEEAEIPDSMIKKAEKLASDGKTPIYFTENGKLLGIIAVADTVKEDSPKAIKELKNMGIDVIMLTGDNKNTADAIGRTANVDKVIAGVLPAEKEKVIRELQKENKVMMVGDGINDSPALTRADIGIALGSGTDIAIDSADVVIMKSSLSDVVSAIKLSRAVVKNIHENLLWAFGYNIIGIPLAAGVFVNLFGWSMNPMFGALAMSLSSFLVVSNALRLNFVKIKDKNEAKSALESQTDGKIKKTIKIKGMMCSHCENRVKQALMNMPETEKASADSKKGTATVVLKSDVTDEKLRSVIEAEGYKFIKVKK